jgi:hypothetical protein
MRVNPGYEKLAGVLQRALDQAQDGKGKERHANDLPFHLQPMQQIAKRRGVGFLLGQADKKSEEATSLPAGRDVAELLGAINYLAGAVIFLETQRADNAVITSANDNQFACQAAGFELKPVCAACFGRGRCLGNDAKPDMVRND